MTKGKNSYPSPAQIRRLVEAARDAGFQVVALKINSAGEVTIVDKSVLPIKDEDNDLSRYV